MNPQNCQPNSLKRRKWDLFRYHFDEACLSILDESELIPIAEFQNRIKQKYGSKCYAKTIARLNRRLEAEHGIAPLRIYCELNPEFYQTVGKHRKGTPTAWKKYAQEDTEHKPNDYQI